FHPANRGKGAAIRAALEAATGDLIVIQDGDLEYDPNDYLKLIRLIEQQGASVAYGNRWHPGNKRISYRRYLLGGRLLTTLANVLYDADIHDEPTCYKMFRAEVIKGLKLTCERFEFCPEVTAKVRRLGYRIHEAPISYAPRGFAEGKKIRWHDGLEAIWVLCKCRFANLKSLRR
ncbi:MAG: glycosyltransferase, partial [Planctomycetes bacterium]|nr:glycosyltransferase [Planctomycetota bacterium]